MANNSTLTFESYSIFHNDFLPPISNTAYIIIYMIVCPMNMFLAIFGNIFSIFALKQLSESVKKSYGPTTGKLSDESKKQGYFYQYLIIINDLITLIFSMSKFYMFH